MNLDLTSTLDTSLGFWFLIRDKKNSAHISGENHNPKRYMHANVHCNTIYYTIPRRCKQPKCPSTEERIKKMWCIYTMECYSAIKKNEMMLFAATWVDLENTILSKVRQRKTNIICYHSHVESNFKKWYKWTYLQNRNRLTDIENKLMVTKGETYRGGREQ